MQKTKKQEEPPKPKSFSVFDCAKAMGEKLALWVDRSPEFRKAYSQFMLNRLMTLDSRFFRLLEQATTMKFTNQQHHDFFVSIIAGKGWSLRGYKDRYPKNDDSLVRAVCLYYEIGTADARLAASRMSEEEARQMLIKAGMAKEHGPA
jgi:hypothetical protein